MRRSVLEVIRLLLDEHQRIEPHHADMCKTCRKAEQLLAAKPKRAVRAAAVRRKAVGLSKKEAIAVIRGAVVSRANGKCENCGHRPSEFGGAWLELDHFQGRARSESIETCWLLCNACHTRKTRNDPDAAYWLRSFINHARAKSYDNAAEDARRRLVFVESRAALSKQSAEVSHG